VANYPGAISESPSETIDLNELSRARCTFFQQGVSKLSSDQLMALKAILTEQNQWTNQQLKDFDSGKLKREEKWRAECLQNKRGKNQKIAEIDALLQTKKRGEALERQVQNLTTQKDNALQKVKKLEARIEEGDPYLRHFHGIAKRYLPHDQYQEFREMALTSRDRDIARDAAPA